MAIVRRCSRHPKMKSAVELYLDHLDRITGLQGRFTQISPPEIRPSVYVAIYRGFPSSDVYSAFTVGLSFVPPPDQPDAHHELILVMRSTDDSWAFAMGELAFQLRGRVSFTPNQHFGFGAQISEESPMSCFFTHFPHAISATDACIALPDFRTHLIQLYPIYESERAFIRDHDSAAFISRIEPSQLYDPRREPVRNV